MTNLVSRFLRYIRFYFELGSRTRSETIEELVDLCVDSPILLSQVRSEIVDLAKVLKELAPKISMEIGTNYGGTLFLLFSISPPDAEILSVDLPNGPFGGGYPARKIPLYKRFPQCRQKLHLLQGNSHSTEMLDRIRKILRGRLLDYLFIDADHTYSGVKSDFAMYSPLVRSGGIVAFHDIVAHRNDASSEVHLFWQEVKLQYRHLEFVEDVKNGALPLAVTKSPMDSSGIGILFVP
jgi:hypothetical protein